LVFEILRENNGLESSLQEPCLLAAGACMKWRNSQGRCAVQVALEMGVHNVLEFFLKSGIDVTKRPNLTYAEPGYVHGVSNAT